MNDNHLTEVERLLDPDERRTTNRDIAMSRERQASDFRRVSIAAHAAFREALAGPPPVDPIDDLLEELRNIKPEEIDE